MSFLTMQVMRQLQREVNRRPDLESQSDKDELPIVYYLCRASSASTLLRPHKVSPRLAVPPEIGRPPYVDTGQAPWSDEPEIHDQEV